MKLYKTIQLRGYSVKGTDNRTGEPFIDTIALDVDTIRAAEAVKIGVIPLIEEQYNRKGFYVTEITRLKNVVAKIDLTALYQPDLADLGGVYKPNMERKEM